MFTPSDERRMNDGGELRWADMGGLSGRAAITSTALFRIAIGFL